MFWLDRGIPGAELIFVSAPPHTGTYISPWQRLLVRVRVGSATSGTNRLIASLLARKTRTPRGLSRERRTSIQWNAGCRLFARPWSSNIICRRPPSPPPPTGCALSLADDALGLTFRKRGRDREKRSMYRVQRRRLRPTTPSPLRHHLKHGRPACGGYELSLSSVPGRPDATGPFPPLYQSYISPRQPAPVVSVCLDQLLSSPISPSYLPGQQSTPCLASWPRLISTHAPRRPPGASLAPTDFPLHPPWALLDPKQSSPGARHHASSAPRCPGSPAGTSGPGRAHPSLR